MNYFNLLVTVVLALLAVPALLSCGYLSLVTLLSAAQRPLPPSSRQLRFDVIVPAHNEISVIHHVIGSLKQLDWPQDRYRVVVVADNCTDGTAAAAAAAGADVLERHDPGRRGKGYALDFAFKASRARGWADAVVVVDADALVSKNLLEAYARRMERGADAVQAHYGVSNTGVSWRTRLLGIAKAAFHIVRSRARERLRLSCGIRGNGWAVTHRLLERVPYGAYSLTEDLEYGITLGLAGYRVHYADEAHADAEMVSGGGQEASKQRQRWERGRFQLIRTRTLPLLAAAVRLRSRVCLDLALDLMVLPLSYVALNVMALLAVAGVTALAGHPLSALWLWVGLACVAALALHILRGWQLSGAGLQGLIDLLQVPRFLLWKLIVMLPGRRSSPEWVRTKREGS
jgi:cellulose synthase/poly-beta-1,6-N-acetylglucosamine synthase-like glycosyltransferase